MKRLKPPQEYLDETPRTVAEIAERQGVGEYAVRSWIRHAIQSGIPIVESPAPKRRAPWSRGPVPKTYSLPPVDRRQG